MELYGYWRSSCSYRVRIALHWKGIPFTHRGVHLVKDGGQQHAQDYRDLNPMRQVPCLIHQGRAIGQSMAIIEYLETVHPKPPLFPPSPLMAAQVRQICETINAGIQPLQNLSVLQHMKGELNFDDDAVQTWVRHWIGRGFTALESMLTQTAGTYCLGDAITAADAFLVPQVYNAARFQLAMTAYPRITAIHAACMSLPAFQEAAPDRQPDAPENS